MSKRFRLCLHGKRVICLGNADDYDCMEPARVQLLRDKVPRFL